MIIIFLLPSALSPQDLSSECTRSQELSAEVQRLRESLQAAEAELVATSASLSQSRDRADSLSRLLHQRRTENGGDRAGADVSVRQPLSRESSCVGQTPEAGGGRDSPVTEEGDAGEAERQLRERLMALEKEVLQPRQPESPKHIYDIHIT